MLAAVVACIVAAVGGVSPPEVFAPCSLQQAEAQAEAAGRYLLVSVAASWCGPCAAMDQEAWVDDTIVAWVRANAVAVRVDPDLDPDAAAALAARGPDSIVTVRRGGRELDRVVGYRDARQLRAFLDGVAEGTRAVDRYRRLAGDRSGRNVDVRARLDLARALILAKDYEGALDEYHWLWHHTRQEHPEKRRLAIDLGLDLQRLCREYAPAAELFGILRDVLEAEIELPGPRAQAALKRSDWIELNAAVGEPQQTLAWLDWAIHDQREKAIVTVLLPQMLHLLCDHRRWDVAGAVVRDPQGLLKQIERVEAGPRVPAGASPEALAAHEARRKRAHYRIASLLYAGALSAGREQRAEDLLQYAMLKHNEDPGLLTQMVEAALDAGEPRPHQVKWLKGDDFKALRERVDRAMNPPA